MVLLIVTDEMAGESMRGKVGKNLGSFLGVANPLQNP